MDFNTIKADFKGTFSFYKAVFSLCLIKTFCEAKTDRISIPSVLV